MRFSLQRITLLLLLIIFCWIFTDLAWDLHRGMRTHKADLGQIAQAVWNSSRGRFVEMTDNGSLSTRMTDHVEPILALISPALWLWRDVKMLLLLQVLFSAVGAWLLYELVIHQFRTLPPEWRGAQRWQAELVHQVAAPIALALVAAFLLSPQIQNALLTEFHAAPLAVPFILWAFLSAEREKWGQFAAAALLVASVKEEMALLAAGLGLWGGWRFFFGRWGFGKGDERLSSQNRIRGSSTYLIPLAVTLTSLLWFYLTTFVIVPAHAVTVYESAENPYWARYGALGNTPLEIGKSFFSQPLLIWQIVSEPVRLNYLHTLLANFGYFSLLAPEILLLSAPLLLANLLSTYPPQYYGEFHYSAPLVAYFGVSAAFGALRLWRVTGHRLKRTTSNFQVWAASSTLVMTLGTVYRSGRTALRPLIALLIGAWILGWSLTLYLQEGRGPGGGRGEQNPVRTHHLRINHFVAQIPPDAAVTATAAVHPHVALRRFVYQFPLGMPEFGRAGEAEWALLDVTTNTDLAPGDLHDMVRQMLAGDWGIVDADDGFLLLRRGTEAKEIPHAFYKFVRIGREREAEQMALSFSEVSLDDRPRWRSTAVTSEWLVGPQFDPERDRPRFMILRPDGRSIYRFGDSTPTALIWYPPERWRPGERLRITTPVLYLPRAWGIAVGQEAAAQESNLAIEADGWRWVAAYVRNSTNQMARLPDPLTDGAAAVRSALINSGTAAVSGIDARADVAPFASSSEPLRLQAQLLTARVWPDNPSIDLVLSWVRKGAWPEQLTPFVHLRQGDEIRAQADGLPRWFLPYSEALLTLNSHHIVDWRQMSLPEPERAMAEDAQWEVVIGLYDTDSGERAELFDEEGTALGQELHVGTIETATQAVPDFTCALVAATCAAQTADGW